MESVEVLLIVMVIIFLLVIINFNAFITSKVSRKWRYLIWAFILLLGPGIFLYEMEFKGTMLATSTSPGNEHKIKVIEKGSAYLFGPSKVRIKSGWRNTDRLISNDGAKLYPSNISIEWKSNNIALITLSGDEQGDERIEYDAKEKEFKTINE